jgi:glucuronate isomerase
MAGKPFMGEDFLLETEEGMRLYHECAAPLPIIDYHCHLSPSEIAEDVRWENLAQLWLAGDHYKWRVMRSAGVAEEYCTGDTPDWEKFEKWAAVIPFLLRNPLYHWTHLELKRYFGITELLSSETAKEIWEQARAALSGPEMSCRGLLRSSRVRLLCTTDDPTDTLEHHAALRADPSFDVQVLPAWRPDRGMAIENPAAFNAWVDLLAERANVDVIDFASYIEALRRRHDFFHESGCCLSDHGLDTAYAEDYTDAEVEAVFAKLRAGTAVGEDDARKFKSAMLYEFGVMDHEKGWAQQYHFGAMRNNNTRLFARVGPDTGFDSVGDCAIAAPLARMLDRLERAGRLARTILYNLNPRDNAVMATMLGNFQDGSVPGKMQYGAAWWVLDQKDGMERQMEDLSEMGVLRLFVGMVTDSRSFLSYTRHEYFRRILCNLLGKDMKAGLIPGDMELVGSMVRDICYNNAVRYFRFDLPVE